MRPSGSPGEIERVSEDRRWEEGQAEEEGYSTAQSDVEKTDGVLEVGHGVEVSVKWGRGTR